MDATQTTRLTWTPGFRRLLLPIALLFGVIGAQNVWTSLEPAKVQGKDFISQYLMAKAIAAGVNPYLPMDELARILIPEAGYRHFTHPTPHPAITGLLVLPLAALSYETAARLWLLMETGVAILGIVLLFRWWGARASASRVLLTFCLALGWRPLVEDLWFGQWTLTLTVLLIGAWLLLRTGRDVWGGLALGAVVAMKLIAWPIVLFLLLRRRWVGAFVAGGAFLAANALGAATLGLARMQEYYLTLGPSVARLYRANEYNFSAWTIGNRLFVGGGHYVMVSPLWHSEALARAALILAPLLVLAAGLWSSARCRDFDSSFGILAGLSVLLTPVAWPHYLLFFAIPMIVIARKLQRRQWPRTLSLQGIALFIVISWSQIVYSFVVARLQAMAPSGALVTVPFLLGALNLLPALGFAGLAWLLWRLDGVSVRSASAAAPEPGPQGSMVTYA